MPTPSPHVVIAMSGGVDSSVAALLLKQQGYTVTGMMMRLWSEDCGTGGANRCCTPDQVADARRVAAQVGIPFYVLDSQELFRSTIVESFIAAYAAGQTPNPCLECNRLIRFDWLLNHARALGADYLATGHYARITCDADGTAHLHAGRDPRKDQSYVLSVLTQAALRRVLFPLGDYTKPEVRQLAAEAGLPVANKHDSQDLCFLADGDYRRFLREHAPAAIQPGPILTRDGRTLGQHSGLPHYTIGQRKGLGLSFPEPLYVIELDAPHNALIVGTLAELGRDRLRARRVNWLSGSAPDEPFRASVKIRYKSAAAPALVIPIGESECEVAFDAPLRDITPGQGAVIYAGDEVLGGGIIGQDAARG